MAPPQPAADLDVGLHSSHVSFYLARHPLVQLQVYLFCSVLELECTSFIAGDGLVVGLRTVNASPCKTNYWGRNSSSSFFTSSSLLFWRLRHVDALWLPTPVVHPGPGLCRGAPELNQQKARQEPATRPSCTPEASAICLLSFCHYSSLCSCLYFILLVSQLLIMVFFLKL